MTREQILNSVFKIKTNEDFEELTLEVFKYQAANNSVYSKYLNFLNRDPKSVKEISDIVFLPIEIFKTEKVLSHFEDAETVFTSSSTTGTIPARHFVPDVMVYEQSFQSAFKLFYGNPKEYCILALLPSYLERSGSSLIYMMDKLINLSGHPLSGFYLNNHDELSEVLLKLKLSKQKTLLIGVSFALLDFVEKHKTDFPELIVMETGGMKGRREELVREDLHKLLCLGFSVKAIHSEYGMTELLSQAYSVGQGIFNCPPWMRIVLREPNDAFSLVSKGKTGGINIIDLANIDSCAFIETQDLGKVLEDNSFEVLGRFDTSDLRGCNLMVL